MNDYDKENTEHIQTSNVSQETSNNVGNIKKIVIDENMECGEIHGRKDMEYLETSFSTNIEEKSILCQLSDKVNIGVDIGSDVLNMMNPETCIELANNTDTDKDNTLLHREDEKESIRTDIIHNDMDGNTTSDGCHEYNPTKSMDNTEKLPNHDGDSTTIGNHDNDDVKHSCSQEENSTNMIHESSFMKNQNIQVDIHDTSLDDENTVSTEYVIINDMVILYSDKNDSQCDQRIHNSREEQESEESVKKIGENEIDSYQMRNESSDQDRMIQTDETRVKTLSCKVVVMCSNENENDNDVSRRQDISESQRDIDKNDTIYENLVPTIQTIDEKVPESVSTICGNDCVEHTQKYGDMLVPYSDSDDSYDDDTMNVVGDKDIQQKIMYKHLLLSPDPEHVTDKNNDITRNIEEDIFDIYQNSQTSHRKVFVSFESDDSDGTYSGSTSYSEMEQPSHMTRELTVMSSKDMNCVNVNEFMCLDDVLQTKIHEILEDMSRKLLYIYNEPNKNGRMYTKNRTLSMNDVIDDISQKVVMICLEEEKGKQDEEKKYSIENVEYMKPKIDLVKKPKLILHEDFKHSKNIATEKVYETSIDDVDSSCTSRTQIDTTNTKYRDVGVQTTLHGYHIQMFYSPTGRNEDLRNDLNNRRYDILPDRQDIISSELDIPHIPHVSHKKTCVSIDIPGLLNIYLYNVVNIVI